MLPGASCPGDARAAHGPASNPMHARIGRLVYGASDPKVGAVAELDRLAGSGALFNHRLDCLGGVLAVESSELIRGFFEKRRGRKSERGS